MMVATLLSKGHSGWREEKNPVSPSALGPKVSLQEELTRKQTLTMASSFSKAKVDENSRVCLSIAEGYLSLQVISRKKWDTSEPGARVFALKDVVVL